MRSRTSFSKYVRELFSKQLWVLALSFFGYFMIGPVLFLLRIGEWEQWTDMNGFPLSKTAIAQQFLDTVRLNGAGAGLMSVFILGCLALGTVAAWNGFGWLHARDKVDLYHALPVRRQKQFLAQVLIVLIDYVVPALVWVVLSALAAAVKGIFSGDLLIGLLVCYVLGLIICLFAFAIASLAMMLTGRLLVGILGTGVFWFYDLLAGLLVRSYRIAFYDTYRDQYVSRITGIGPRVLFPMEAAFYTFQNWYGGDGWKQALIILAATIVIAGLALFAYLKRPSEAAGRSMAFFRIGEGIRLILSVTAGLLIGYLFKESTSSGADLWFVFGLVLGFVFTYALMQMIYTMDLRKCFSGKIVFAAGLVLTLGIAAFYRFDLSGYDSYLPAMDKIDTISFSVDGQVGCIYASNMYEDNRDQHSQMKCDEQLYKVLERFVSGQDIYSRAMKGDLVYEESHYRNVSVRLKNGRTYARTYIVFQKDVEEELIGLFSRKEYAEATWPVLAVDEDKLLGLRIQYKKDLVDDTIYQDGRADTEEPVNLEQESAEKVFKALCADLTSHDPGVFIRQIPVAAIECQLDLSGAGFGDQPHYPVAPFGWAEVDEDTPIWDVTVPVYPCFEQTIAAMKEEGIQEAWKPEAADVERIHLWNNDENGGEEITDPQQIAQMLEGFTYDCLIPSDQCGISSWTQSGPYATVYIKRSGQSEMACSGCLAPEDKEILVLSDRVAQNMEAATEGLTELP